MDINMLKLLKPFLKGKFKLYFYFGKKLFDFTFSFFSLIVLLPVLLVIFILIKLVDPGPILFKQERIGLNGDTFVIYKFRSMPVGTKNMTSDQIGRLNLTWMGKFIRRTNIDELPQLFNILKGEMSIVGPRPALLSQKSLIEYRHQNGSFFCRPGLTGLAQISSYDGMGVFEKAKLDGKYYNSISFKSDMLIIFKTFLYILKPPPVY